MKTITTLISERDFNRLRINTRLEFEDKEENIKVVLKYLKEDAKPASKQGIP